MGRRAYLDDKNLAEIMRLSYETIRKAFESPTLSEEMKVEMASKFIAKAIPQSSEHSAEELMGAIVYHLRSPRPKDALPEAEYIADEDVKSG